MLWRILRPLLLLSPAFALLGAGIWFLASQYQKPIPESSPEGRLVVVVVVDQLRADYLERFATHFSNDGFEKLKQEGVWYSQAHVPFASTFTGPGHASIATGADPSVHGIVDNAWYDSGRGRKVICSTGDRAYERVPLGRAPKPLVDGGLAPERLLIPTVGDVLVASKQGRTFSLAIKDRTAVLLGGKNPDGVYCYDPLTGDFITSTFYRERLPGWVEQFNRDRHVDAWILKPWERLLPTGQYVPLGLDDAPGERAGITSKEHTFPHTISPDGTASEAYYTNLEATPMANELVWKLAENCIQEEKLGQTGQTDLLFLGLSANDPIGHAFGPDSHEVMDATVRTDRLMEVILKSLTEKFGAGRFTLIVTADHGVCPLPERATASEAVRFDPSVEYSGLETVLVEKFGPGPWVEKLEFPWVYLNRRLIQSQKLKSSEVEEVGAQWAANRPAVAEQSFSRTALTGPALDSTLGQMVQRSFHPDRSGDVYLVAKPGCLPLGKLSTGTTHGSPHPYDTHVPILAIGHGIPKFGKQSHKVSALITTPIIAHSLGLSPLPQAVERLPVGW
ncbi:MAG: alkaline phosphatase family protein [Fimbriiglobus sp.]